jgi:hypothetical protein
MVWILPVSAQLVKAFGLCFCADFDGLDVIGCVVKLVARHPLRTYTNLGL